MKTKHILGICILILLVLAMPFSLAQNIGINELENANNDLLSSEFLRGIGLVKKVESTGDISKITKIEDIAPHLDNIKRKEFVENIGKIEDLPDINAFTSEEAVRNVIYLHDIKGIEKTTKSIMTGGSGFRFEARAAMTIKNNGGDVAELGKNPNYIGSYEDDILTLFGSEQKRLILG